MPWLVLLAFRMQYASQESGLLENDVSRLSALLTQEAVTGDADVAELLRGIETADGMAQDVEKKLDEMLNNLDELLASLETTVTEVESTSSK